MLSASKRRFIRALLTVVLVSGAALAVSSFTAAERACAEGTCCSEPRSICNIGGGDHENYYKKACDGSCYTRCQEE